MMGSACPPRAHCGMESLGPAERSPCRRSLPAPLRSPRPRSPPCWAPAQFGVLLPGSEVAVGPEVARSGEYFRRGLEAVAAAVGRYRAGRGVGSEAKRGWHRSLTERSRPGSGLGAGAERRDLRCGPAAWLWFLGVRGRLAVPYCASAAVLRSAASRGRSGAVPVGAVLLRCFAAAAGPPEAAPGPGTGSRLAARSGYGRGGVVGAQLRSHEIPVAPGWERGGLCSQRGGFPCCPSGSSHGTSN